MGETINAGLLSSLAHYFMNTFAQYRVNLHDLVTCLSHSRLQILADDILYMWNVMQDVV